MQIAATAIQHGLELVTGNLRHFERVPGLQIQPLLPGSASCGVIVTSRQPLGSLRGAQLLKLEAMSPEEGLDYLKQQLGLVRVQAELAAAQEIVDLCAGLTQLAQRKRLNSTNELFLS